MPKGIPGKFASPSFGERGTGRKRVVVQELRKRCIILTKAGITGTSSIGKCFWRKEALFLLDGKAKAGTQTFENAVAMSLDCSVSQPPKLTVQFELF